jgi:hypothetical protein
MAGYAIQARIDGVRPRLSARDGSAPDQDGPTAWPRFDDDPAFRHPFALAREPAPTLAERWDQASRVWSEMTFFLFDPQSWR